MRSVNEGWVRLFSYQDSVKSHWVRRTVRFIQSCPMSARGSLTHRLLFRSPIPGSSFRTVQWQSPRRFSRTLGLTRYPGYSNPCLGLAPYSNLLFYKWEEKDPETLANISQGHPCGEQRSWTLLLASQSGHGSPPTQRPIQKPCLPVSGFTLKPFCLEKRNLFSLGRLPSLPPQIILSFKQS